MINWLWWNDYYDLRKNEIELVKMPIRSKLTNYFLLHRNKAICFIFIEFQINIENLWIKNDILVLPSIDHWLKSYIYTVVFNLSLTWVREKVNKNIWSSYSWNQRKIVRTQRIEWQICKRNREENTWIYVQKRGNRYTFDTFLWNMTNSPSINFC